MKKHTEKEQNKISISPFNYKSPYSAQNAKTKRSNNIVWYYFENTEHPRWWKAPVSLTGAIIHNHLDQVIKFNEHYYKDYNYLDSYLGRKIGDIKLNDMKILYDRDIKEDGENII